MLIDDPSMYFMLAMYVYVVEYTNGSNYRTQQGGSTSVVLNPVKRHLTEYQDDYLKPSTSLSAFPSHSFLSNNLLTDSAS